MQRISPDARRDQLRIAAFAVIARDGVAGATTRAITTEAGMSLASFHYVYESRDALLAEVLGAGLEVELEMIRASFDPELPILEAARSAMYAYVDYLRQRPDIEQGLFELILYGLRSTDMAEVSVNVYAHYYAAAETLLSEATAALGVRWSRPLREVAEVMVAMNDGIGLAWLSTRDDALALRLANAAAELLVSMVEGEGR
ncbi:TetR/AcrR family transcriptional regulator [Naasia lichenicola]|uniref:TetR/AcrR family transcriptional regulator n=1 Tax=Naasia lichenicola TaxID=2565933 RepID=A0A4S4FE72_9MICO|nr:TetR family transcriptional regulator [Naasia lichenicola]THG28413.1 TetR/AcrR family transcriptional regulator [Naasia lichenicola]